MVYNEIRDSFKKSIIEFTTKCSVGIFKTFVTYFCIGINISLPN